MTENVVLPCWVAMRLAVGSPALHLAGGKKCDPTHQQEFGGANSRIQALLPYHFLTQAPAGHWEHNG